MSEEQIERIRAAMRTLDNYLADIETLAKAVKERDELRKLLHDILSKVERGVDGDLYARDGSGLRLLPRAGRSEDVPGATHSKPIVNREFTTWRGSSEYR